jgi:hypothetical protein
MGMIGVAAKAGMKWTVWARILILAEIALAVKRHLDLLDSREKDDLQRLVRKSKGKPSNLTARERRRLSELVAKVEPSDFVREAATMAVPWRKPR